MASGYALPRRRRTSHIINDVISNGESLRYYLKQNRESALSKAGLSVIQSVEKRDYGINAVISFCVRKIIKSGLRTGFGDKKLYVVPKVLRKRQNKTYNDKNRIKEGFSNEEGIIKAGSEGIEQEFKGRGRQCMCTAWISATDA